jgi:hypothetical protein
VRGGLCCMMVEAWLLRMLRHAGLQGMCCEQACVVGE